MAFSGKEKKGKAIKDELHTLEQELAALKGELKRWSNDFKLKNARVAGLSDFQSEREAVSILGSI